MLPVDTIINQRVLYDVADSYKIVAVSLLRNVFKSVEKCILESRASQKYYHEAHSQGFKGRFLALSKFDGPYRVVKRVEEMNYAIKKSEGRSGALTIYHNRLKPDVSCLPWGYEVLQEQDTGKGEEKLSLVSPDDDGDDDAFNDLITLQKVNHTKPAEAIQTLITP
ncbi:hypothetical protein QYM36_004247 [Artemia franciscana]|uniref:Integrase p58-like C-terminal domain-containing protein n=1 Tax=Artemia franciscana TaxID=6661 RepID=A0AA88IG66_ARTSF|nr:hypothetical protein QYM36_004247 [Artemia franciscana]